MEDEHDEKMKVLKVQHDEEKEKKTILDNELHLLRDELSRIEENFPRQIEDLKEEIESAKILTQEYEERNFELQKEIDHLKKANKLS